MSRTPIAALAVVAALALGTGVTGSSPSPAPPAASAEQVEVVGSTAVCPDLQQTAGVLTTRTSVGVAPGPDTGPGTIEAARVTGTGAPLPIPVRQPGQVAVGLGAGVSGDGLLVTATGSLAAGLEAEQVTRGEQGAARGLAGLRCEPPRTDTWFEGGGTLVGDVSVLVLANVDDTAATVDVAVFSSTGAVDPRPGRGITVAPHRRLVINLDTLAPDRARLAVHVKSVRGRVAAGLRHAKSVGPVPQGVDWVPQAAAPARSVVVPGVPAGPGIRTLWITNPTTDDTVAQVQVTTQDGQFVPTEFAQVNVPAGTTVERRLDVLARNSALAVTVTSASAPVLAGALIVDLQGGPIREFAYAAGAAPLSGPALVTDLLINGPTESTLVLSAPQAAATVVVTPLRVLGTDGAVPPAKTVSVPAGRSAVLRLSTFFPPGTTARLAVDVRPSPTSGPVYGARYLSERGERGALTTLLVLRGPAQRVPRPLVARDPLVGAGG